MERRELLKALAAATVDSLRDGVSGGGGLTHSREHGAGSFGRQRNGDGVPSAAAG